MKIRVIKIVIAFIVTILIGINLYKVFAWKDTEGISEFYQFPDHTIDVIFYGNSHSYCAVNEAVLWQQYGIAACNMGESSQSIGTTYYYMKESLKTQRPQYMLVEVYPAIVSDGYMMVEDVYRNTLSMHWSRDYLDNLSYSLLQMSEDHELSEQLLLKFPIIHSRYNELTRRDYMAADSKMGRYMVNWISTPFDVPDNKENQYTTPIAETSEMYLQKICDLAKEYDIPLGFWEAPYYISDYDYTRLNTVKSIAARNGVAFMNFNDYYDEQEINFNQYMFDSGHVNSYGAVKISESFGRYLAGEAKIPDRRGDDRYVVWNEIAQNWNHDVQTHLLTSTSTLMEYMPLLGQTEDTIIMLELTGNYRNHSNADIQKLFEQLGMNQQSFEAGGVFVKQGDIFLFYSAEDQYLWHTELPSDSFATQGDLAVSKNENGTSIVVNTKNYRKVNDGINIVVYDCTLNQVVDAVGFNANDGFSCVRE